MSKLFAVFLTSFCLLFHSAAGPASATQETPLLRPFTGDFEAMAKRRLVRIIVPYSKTIYFIDKGAQYGTAVDFGRELEKVLNAGREKEIEKIRVAFIPTARDELIPALNEGRGDIIMANLTVTPERQKLVDFAAPLFDNAKEVLVAAPSAPEIGSLDDLGGKEIFVRRSSSYYEHLAEINRSREAAGKPLITLHPMDESLEDEDLLEMVNAGLLPWTVVDEYKARIWASVFPDIKTRDDVLISSEGQIAWAIRKNSPELKSILDKFAEEHRIGTTFGNMLRNKFYKSDKMVHRAYAPDDLKKFRDLLAIFRQYGSSYSFDYLMLAAQGYQESQLNQSRRSPRGAVGIMQLLPSTAADKAVGIKGIDKSAERNVEAGTKYLRHLIDTYLNEPGLTPREQFLFAFAAYNAGPANLKKFRQKAEEMGLDRDRWFGNVENGAAAIVGRETVQYVGNIYKYYIAYNLLADKVYDPDAAKN
ncbi:transglycosylase SLT domain-containing protein [Rhizobium sp. RAF56]|jgi:membrane-bound lytic murein transglycosylase MltF|uniref:transglycosylase SLT domain-containing protein n=1 Tax=Rhizobium sp. RAF56 TaxID=3233062 RepID=UPI003F9B31EC